MALMGIQYTISENIGMWMNFQISLLTVYYESNYSWRMEAQ